MLRRMTLMLDANEAAALEMVAQAELRPPRDQARLLIRQSLQDRGFTLTTEVVDHPNVLKQSGVQSHASAAR